MRACRLTDRAQDDVAEICDYVAQDDDQAAKRLVDKFGEAFARLTDWPGIGRVRPEISVGIRSWVVGSYVVLYRSYDDRIDVIRVIHGARDIAALFSGEDE